MTFAFSKEAGGLIATQPDTALTVEQSGAIVPARNGQAPAAPLAQAVFLD